MNGKRNNHISVYQLCLVAMAVVMNAAGAQLALTLRLPVYLDSIGTIMAGAGLWDASEPAKRDCIRDDDRYLFSLFCACRNDCRFDERTGVENESGRKREALAGGGSGGCSGHPCQFRDLRGCIWRDHMFLVQLLARTPLGMTASIFVVQVVTDYLDRFISLFVVMVLLHTLPYDLKRKWKGELRHGDSTKPL